MSEAPRVKRWIQLKVEDDTEELLCEALEPGPTRAVSERSVLGGVGVDVQLPSRGRGREPACVEV